MGISGIGDLPVGRAERPAAACPHAPGGCELLLPRAPLLTPLSSFTSFFHNMLLQYQLQSEGEWLRAVAHPI